MGWQDRDYARGGGSYRPTWTSGRAGGYGGRSIVTTLIVINVGIYLLGALNADIRNFLFGIGAMQSKAVMQGHLWRLITAQYLHGGEWHLFINMLVLHFLGRPLERMWSPKKFFVVYTLCGLFGNVFYTVLGARGWIDPQMPAVGASGSINGLLGIVAVLFPTATVYVYFLFPIRIRTAAYIFGGIAVLKVLQKGNNYGGEACHLAGLVFGVWWAMKGDRWWSKTEWRIPRRGKKVRPVRKGGFRERVAQRSEDAELIDRILKKVYDGGIHSLSERDKRALQDATQRQRQREADADRVDRL